MGVLVTLESQASDKSMLRKTSLPGQLLRDHIQEWSALSDLNYPIRHPDFPTMPGVSD